MIYLAILSFIILLLYLWITCYKYGIPNVISDGYYISKYKWVFSTTMIVISGLLLPVMLELGKNDFGILAFISVLGVFILSAEPHFKNKWESKIHNTAAIVAMISSQIWCFINCWQSSIILWVGVLLSIIFIYLRLNKLNIYLLEVASFINVYLTILIIYGFYI